MRLHILHDIIATELPLEFINPTSRKFAEISSNCLTVCDSRSVCQYSVFKQRRRPLNDVTSAVLHPLWHVIGWYVVMKEKSASRCGMASRGQKQISLDMCMTALVGYFMRLDHVYWRKTDALKRTGFKYTENYLCMIKMSGKCWILESRRYKEDRIRSIVYIN